MVHSIFFDRIGKVIIFNHVFRLQFILTARRTHQELNSKPLETSCQLKGSDVTNIRFKSQELTILYNQSTISTERKFGVSFSYPTKTNKLPIQEISYSTKTNELPTLEIKQFQSSFCVPLPKIDHSLLYFIDELKKPPFSHFKLILQFITQTNYYFYQK